MCLLCTVLALGAVSAKRRPVPRRKNRVPTPGDTENPIPPEADSRSLEEIEQAQGEPEDMGAPPGDEDDAYAPPDIGEQKYSDLLSDAEKTSGICEDYCVNPCSQFAWGSDTIKECNGCGEDKQCAPGKPHYGDEWKHIRNEL